MPYSSNPKRPFWSADDDPDTLEMWLNSVAWLVGLSGVPISILVLLWSTGPWLTTDSNAPHKTPVGGHVPAGVFLLYLIPIAIVLGYTMHAVVGPRLYPRVGHKTPEQKRAFDAYQTFTPEKQAVMQDDYSTSDAMELFRRIETQYDLNEELRRRLNARDVSVYLEDARVTLSTLQSDFNDLKELG